MRESWVPSKITLDKIRNDMGEGAAKLFHDKYRISRERCNNPNNKDYKNYAGKFKFKNLTDFYENCYEDFKQSYYKYNGDLSIDRIDGKLGYEPGNVRFVPMKKNLQNKDCVTPVIVIDVITENAVAFNSIREAIKALHGGSSVYNAYKNNRLYRKRYSIEKSE